MWSTCIYPCCQQVLVQSFQNLRLCIRCQLKNTYIRQRYNWLLMFIPAACVRRFRIQFSGYSELFLVCIIYGRNKRILKYIICVYISSLPIKTLRLVSQTETSISVIKIQFKLVLFSALAPTPPKRRGVLNQRQIARLRYHLNKPHTYILPEQQ